MIYFDSRTEMLRHVPRGGVCCEVGVFASDFSRQIAEFCDPVRLLLVDAFSGSLLFSADEHGGNPRTLTRDELLANSAALANDRAGVEVHIGFSGHVLSSFADESLDFIYIDADHSYNAVKGDLAHAWRLVRPGGFIAGHDYSLSDKCVNADYYQYFGVKSAVDEFLAAHGRSLYGLALDGYTSFMFQK